MRSLPRLSASQAVHNFRDIYSEKDKNYRHVSHVDFTKSQETLNKQGAQMRKKGEASFNGHSDGHQKLLASSDGLCTADCGALS